MTAEELERLRKEHELYRRLLDLGQQSELDPFLAEALSLIVEVTGAIHGFLEVRDAEGDESWTLAHGFRSDQLDEVRAAISSGIIAEALTTGSTIVTHAALLDDRFSSMESVRTGGIEAVLCAPLGGDVNLGVVYLQGRNRSGGFSSEDQEQAEILARHLAPLADRLLARRRARHAGDHTRELRSRHRIEGIVGRSQALARVLEQAMIAAPVDVNVLLTGDSGTGKSQLARVIHENGRRAGKPCIEVNCASLPETLLESELFGARKGAHATATRDIEGKVAAADGGTLFLDEIGELALASQAKLLQLLQSKEYYPLGASRPVRADVRLIAATNIDLERAVAEQRFRADLFHRLQVLPIRLPSLAERSEDLPDLAYALVERICQRHGLAALELSPAAVHALQHADWPGNVRQLENCLEAAAIRAHGRTSTRIGPRELFPERDIGGDEAPGSGLSAAMGFQDATRSFQRDLLIRTLEETDWNVSEAARRLELTRSHVYNLINGFSLERTRS